MDLTLEIINDAGAVTVRKPLHVAVRSDAWRHVVATARRLKDPLGARIRVRDQAGGILVLTSAAGALMVDREAA